jgi:hypothetical protein
MSVEIDGQFWKKSGGLRIGEIDRWKGSYKVVSRVGNGFLLK